MGAHIPPGIYWCVKKWIWCASGWNELPCERAAGEGKDSLVIAIAWIVILTAMILDIWWLISAALNARIRCELVPCSFRSTNSFIRGINVAWKAEALAFYSCSHEWSPAMFYFLGIFACHVQYFRCNSTRWLWQIWLVKRKNETPGTQQCPGHPSKWNTKSLERSEAARHATRNTKLKWSQNS